MDKMSKQVLVVKNEILFKNFLRFNGLSQELGFEKLILDNYEFMIRGEAEVNFSYKQAIPYALIVDQDTNKIFVYKRGGSNSTAGDKRLHNKISFGIGGHIEPCDEDCSDNILIYSLKREIEEELNIVEKNIVSVKLIGFINDDTNEVGKVHLGAFYYVYVKDAIITMSDGELVHGDFQSILDISKMVKSGDYDIETRSEIIYHKYWGL